MKNQVVLVGLGLLVILGACSTLSKNDCQRTNWSERGYFAGTRGASESSLSAQETDFRRIFNKDCLKHAPPVNQEAYLTALKKGYDETYCTVERASSDVRGHLALNSRCFRQSAYQAAYDKNFKQLCTAQYGKTLGSTGQSGEFCLSVKSFKKTYSKKLKNYCGVDQGVVDGSRNQKNENCVEYSRYVRGLEKGYLSYCNYEKGYHDGAQGSVASESVCETRGDYMSGYRQGLGHFCTFENGKSFGQEEETISIYCDRNLHYAFYRGYDIGSQLASLQLQLNEAYSELEDVEGDIQNYRYRVQQAKRNKKQAKTPRQKKSYVWDIETNSRYLASEKEDKKELLVRIESLKQQIQSLHTTR